MMTKHSKSTLLPSLGWIVMASVSSSCSSWHSHGRALAFSVTSSSSYHRLQQQQRSRPFTTTTRRFDSESDHHDWDVLQKKLQQKIQEQQQKETVSQQQRNQEQEETMVLPTPNSDYTALDVVTMCMKHLQDNHVPVANAGLQVCFDFSSDRCRAACGGSLAEFVEYAANPTFGMLLYCQSWKVLSVGPVIAGTPTRGAMQTVLMEVEAASSPNAALASSTSKKAPPPKTPKRFLWTLQQERLPPRQGCWLVHEVMFTNNAFALTM